MPHLLFYQRSALHRALHPFPTRRSSDLSITRGPAKPISAPGSASTRSATNANDAETPPIVGSVRIETNGRCALARDRKSTRLNSSHVKISYAVFCLKKKRKHDKIV